MNFCEDCSFAKKKDASINNIYCVLHQSFRYIKDGCSDFKNNSPNNFYPKNVIKDKKEEIYQK
jgi:hypothetical protein